MMALFAKTLKAAPTLRGLAVERPEADSGGARRRVWPWSQVAHLAGGGTFWGVYRENGEELREDERRVKLLVASGHANAVARRAQRRALRRSWDVGNFRLTERYRTSGVADWCFLGVLILSGPFLGWAAIRCALRGWHSAELLPMGYQILQYAVVVLMLTLMAVPFAALLWLSYRQATKPNVVEAEYTCEGVRARLCDGQNIAMRWQDLEEVGVSMSLSRMRFRDGMTLWFADSHSRTRSTHRLVEDRFLPRPIERSGNPIRRLTIRLVMYCLVGAIVAGLLGYHFSPVDKGLRWLVPPLCMLAFGAVFLLGPHAIPRIQRIQLAARRWSRRWRRRRRGRAEPRHSTDRPQS